MHRFNSRPRRPKGGLVAGSVAGATALFVILAMLGESDSSTPAPVSLVPGRTVTTTVIVPTATIFPGNAVPCPGN